MFVCLFICLGTVKSLVIFRLLLAKLYTDVSENIYISDILQTACQQHIRNNTLHVDNFMNPIFASVNIIVIANSNMHTEFCYTISLYSNTFHLGHKTHVSKEPFSKRILKTRVFIVYPDGHSLL